MSLKNPFTGPKEDELVKFAQSVNDKNAAPRHQELLVKPIQATRKAVASVLGAGIGFATLPVELGLNVTGWLGGAVSGSMYKTSHGIRTTRSKVTKILGGEESVAA